MGAELLLSPHSSTPMYAQIMEQIVAKVMAGEWKVAIPCLQSASSPATAESA